MYYEKSYLAATNEEIRLHKKNFLKAINKYLTFRNYLLDSNGKGEIQTIWFDKKAGSWYCQTEIIGYDFGFYGIENNPDGNIETFEITRNSLRNLYVGNIELIKNGEKNEQI